MTEVLQRPESSDGRMEKEFRQRLKEMILRRLTNFQAETEEESEDVEGEFVQDLSQRLSRYFPEYSEGFAEISGVLGQGPLVEEKDAIAEQLARSMSKLLLSQHSPREIDDRFRKVIAEERGWHFVNDLCAYNIKEDKVMLHVPPTFSRPILEVAALFQTGLSEIASEFQTNESLKNIHTVGAASWIIFKHKKSLQEAGWKIVREYPEVQEATAEMPRDKFIETYKETRE